ncbi:hypothetical protein QOZ80_8AG0620370 [Eleusine coracana subsp. coracana]|nr:hypothetical protein QOZ80_8AG0620370 [Eleusine coracana subsp. coracana]
MASSRCCRCRCEQTSTGWAALPRDILVIVFLKLGPRENMRGAEFACKHWRRAALYESELWRNVEMPKVGKWYRGWRAMVRAAVDRGAGQCVSFSGPCHNLSLLHLVEW